jgi:hypothetical protein
MNIINHKLKWNSKPWDFLKVVKFSAHGATYMLVGKPDWLRSLGIPRHRWEDNIKMDLMETGLEGVH